MKKFKCFLLVAVLIAATLPFSASAFSEENETVTENLIEITPQGLMDNAELAEILGEEVVARLQEQALAVEAYNYLLDERFTNEGTIIYPDNYGGEYIEKGKLIILLANASVDEKKAYLDFLYEFKDVIEIKEVKYSLNELERIGENVVKDMLDSMSCGYYVDRKENKVVITVPENWMESQLEDFEKNTDLHSMPVTFEAEKELVPTVSMYGGDGITGPYYGTTLGICGTYGGSPAILTCGHTWSVNNNVYLVGYQTEFIGKIATVRFTDGLQGDYAIAKVTGPNVTTTNRVRSDVTTYAIKGTLSLPVGGLGYRYGAVSGLQALEVTALNKMETIKDPLTNQYINVLGLTSTKHLSGSLAQQGDSGGPYYAMNSSAQWCIVGTVAAIDPNQTPQVVAISPIGLASGFTVKTN